MKIWMSGASLGLRRQGSGIRWSLLNRFLRHRIRDDLNVEVLPNRLQRQSGLKVSFRTLLDAFEATLRWNSGAPMVNASMGGTRAMLDSTFCSRNSKDNKKVAKTERTSKTQA